MVWADVVAVLCIITPVIILLIALSAAALWDYDLEDLDEENEDG